jgi:multidrug efflux pump subunit AcrB
MRIERTEELTQEATRLIKEEVGAGGVDMTVGYVGMFPTNYPIQAVHQWTSGPDEALLRVALSHGASARIEPLKERLREKLDTGLKAWLTTRWKEDGLTPEQIAARLPGLRLSFEPGDLVSEVMSFGSPTAVEVQVSGPNMAANLAHAAKIRERLAEISDLRDVQINPAQDYPTIDITLDRAKAGTMGVTAKGIGLALVPATASSRYMNPIYWRDPANGQAYLVQVQVPPPNMNSTTEIGIIPIRGASQRGAMMPAMENGYGVGHHGMNGAAGGGSIYLRELATTRETTMPAEIDRYNMRRTASITANIRSQDLGRVRREVQRVIAEVGAPPRGVTIDVRGQLDTLRLVQSSLGRGLAAAILAIFLLLVAYFQSIRLALVAVAGIPATLCGVGLILIVTGTTLNLQSFMGAIMALGVSVANAILLVTFAERGRVLHGGAVRAAVEGGRSRLRPILMTSCAMVAGMLPMAIGAAAGGEQTAALGRAVVGGLLASTLTTLLILPAVFALIQRKAAVAAASLDPDDPHSSFYDEDKVRLFEDGA